MLRLALHTTALALLSLCCGCTLLDPVGALTEGEPPPAPASKSALSSAIVIVRFEDETSPGADPNQVREVVFEQTSRFLLEASYGRNWLEGNVFGPFRVPRRDDCALDQIASAADAELARSGNDPSDFRQIVYLHHDPSCASGLAWDAERQRGWLRDDLPPAAWGHLLGHLLFLGHARTLDCGGASLGAPEECAINDTYDRFDVMGNGTEDPPVEIYQWGHPNSVAKERLGWLGDPGTPQIEEVNAPGVYALEALETENLGVKALEIRRPGEDARWFYLELRLAIGFDEGGDRESGVLVHLADDEGSLLLDATPESQIGPSDWIDAALGEGESLLDAESGIEIAVRTIGVGDAMIEIVQRTPDPGYRAPPIRDALNAWLTEDGSRIAVEFDVSDIRTNADWIGLFRTDVASEGAAWFSLTSGRASGTFYVEAPAYGTFEFRYYRGMGTEHLVARSNDVTIRR